MANGESAVTAERLIIPSIANHTIVFDLILI